MTKYKGGYLTDNINLVIKLARMIKADCGFKMPWRIAVNRAYDIIMKLEKRKEYGPGKN